ncbi:MAG TPA: DUF2877 domain-containing protein [Dehalococcoidia bacterium]|nr:DUF2877 domain-containing protein [Dehalococcoidia bacterium]
MSFSDGTIVEFSDASVWHGRGPDSFDVIPSDDLDVASIMRGVMDIHSGQNLGLTLKMIYGQDKAEGAHDSVRAYDKTFLRVASDCVRTLAQSSNYRTPGLDIEVGKPLIGLGPGLTPSGDDFLGGMLFALWHLNSAYPSQFRHDTDSIGNLLEYASSQTNQISYAILTDAMTRPVKPSAKMTEALAPIRSAFIRAGLLPEINREESTLVRCSVEGDIFRPIRAWAFL